MSEILIRYERIDPTSWAYLSSLLVLAVYFKFSRFWSVRNLDLVGLILLSPALLLIRYGIQEAVLGASASLVEQIGYIWLFVLSGLFMIRLLLDPSMVRRPMLEPNLSVGGMTFLGVSLFVFLIANVVTGIPSEADLAGSRRAAQLRGMVSSDQELSTLKTHGPGFPLVYLLPHISTQSLLGDEEQAGETEATEPNESVSMVHVVTARVTAILAQLAIVLGMALVGLRHFDGIRAGIAAATLYLLLPYTAMWTGNVTHALPGALLVWAILFYRWPLLAGFMVGLAFGTIYYPLFLLPLWFSFYWRRGLVRFALGVVAMVGLLAVTLALTSSSGAELVARLQQMFGIQAPAGEGLSGAWQYWNGVYRYPIVAAFVGLSVSFALWPAQKNLGTLISYSAAIMLATQFWHAHTGGLALAWYLPLLLLTVFRPNLEDRVALSVVR
jgi:hypothetical protein